MSQYPDTNGEDEDDIELEIWTDVDTDTGKVTDPQFASVDLATFTSLEHLINDPDTIPEFQPANPLTVYSNGLVTGRRKIPETLRSLFHFSQADCVVALLHRRKQGTVGYTQVFHEKDPKQWTAGCRMAFARAWLAAQRQARQAGRKLDASKRPTISIRKHGQHESGYFFCEMAVLYTNDHTPDTTLLELFSDAEDE